MSKAPLARETHATAPTNHPNQRTIGQLRLQFAAELFSLGYPSDHVYITPREDTVEVSFYGHIAAIQQVAKRLLGTTSQQGYFEIHQALSAVELGITTPDNIQPDDELARLISLEVYLLTERFSKYATDELYPRARKAPLKEAIDDYEAYSIEKSLTASLNALAKETGAASYTEFARIVPIMTDGIRFGIDDGLQDTWLAYSSLEEALKSHIVLYKSHVEQ